jgi:hypothetical protein
VRTPRGALVASLLAASLLGTVTPPAGSVYTNPPQTVEEATPAGYKRPAGKMVPPEGALFGAHVQHEGEETIASEQAAVEELERDIKRTLDIHNYYYAFDAEFPSWKEPYDLAHGRTPLISWGGTDVDQIVNGTHDALIQKRIDSLKALKEPLFMRWFWEMDGRRASKADDAKSPEKFIAAWQYLWKKFAAAKADNVVWVWCPNARGFKNGEAQPFYPGDEYVDWLCTDGYNWNPGRKGDEWRNFYDIFDASYAFAMEHPSKPLMIGEMGAQERASGEKAAWLKDAQEVMKRMPAIAAVVYFDAFNQFEWNVDTSTSSYDAYKAFAADPFYNQPKPGL